MNSNELSIGRELINFVSFDKNIEEAINEKSAFAYRLINREDVPFIVDGLREWLIKSVGIFTTIGYYRSPDLSLWYDADGLREEFDDLLIEFKYYLEVEKAIDVKEEYKLLRYQDNLNFIMFKGTAIGDVENYLTIPEFQGFYSEEDEQRFKYALENANGFIENMISRMSDKFDEIDDPRAFVRDLIGDRLESVLKKHLN